MTEKFEEKTISRDVIYDGAVVHLVRDKVELPDGREAFRELVFHRGAVGIFAVTKEEKIVLVRQFRKALEKSILEIPAGKIEEGEEDYQKVAEREFEEETGYQSQEMNLITSFITSPGISNEKLYLYEAKDFHQVDNPLPQDDDEFLEIVELSFSEAEEKMATGEICDAKTIYAMLYWQQRIEGQK
ncbi:NUDIX hydrolase [Vagococcus silagei]|uniref:NUDIX hydrolase n=1 Tax=Vagococcus silagei TaxID=2508885 RepID=A0A4S3B2P8_9ENTE|nr:NUDIX hydrolase [Vagococcus silagei]THB60678.1 NUDIX hydrolase [Vagococcus silagei]